MKISLLLLLVLVMGGCASCPLQNYEEMIKAKRDFCKEADRQYREEVIPPCTEEEIEKYNGCSSWYTPYESINKECQGFLF